MIVFQCLSVDVSGAHFKKKRGGGGGGAIVR